jgi:hypothetical protein
MKETPKEDLKDFLTRLSEIKDEHFYAPSDIYGHAKSLVNKDNAIIIVKELEKGWRDDGETILFYLWETSLGSKFICLAGPPIDRFNEEMAKARWPD